ncbi:MAG: peptide chain release factor N(5)-glutamine methyltransferase [Clostridiales bacterium]|nr:peptide chain release factor N(5)-glutamine methyltransferase [Clostridiales bacterium]MDD7368082.1 peptide chain release factor N(5)-glutamine methyltransferase [Clostridiales bacterium]
MTWGEWLSAACKRLEESGDLDAVWDADWLLSGEMSVSRAQLRFHRGDALPRDAQARLDGRLDRRVSGEPLQYILGDTGFMGLTFRCDRRALIPRQDTETLVETALGRMKGTARPRVLDLCCGTGAIGLSVAHYRRDARVTLTDVSADALALTEDNRRALNIENAVLRQGDLFEAVRGETFDMILTNPPYLTEDDMAALQREVRLEPALALYGGADGLMFYRRIASEAALYLNAGGVILLEVGQGQAQDVRALFGPPMGSFRVHRDLNGIERVVEAVKGA